MTSNSGPTGFQNDVFWILSVFNQFHGKLIFIIV